MNYFDKYLKYKAKYLELKKQIGGITSTKIKTSGKNFVTVEGLPRGAMAYGTLLEKFIKSKNRDVKSIYCPNEQTCLINFDNVEIANKNLENIRFLINKFDLSLAMASGVSSDIVSASAADSGVKLRTITPKKYYEPWVDRDSKSLFIGLVISPKTQVGKEIYRRLEELNMTKRTGIYSRYDKVSKIYRPDGFLVDPHLTLCTLLVPEGKILDMVIQREWKSIVEKIQKIVHSKIFSKRKQLYSKLGNYKVMGSWVVRDYTDYDERIGEAQFNKRDFDDLLSSIVNEILTTGRIALETTHAIQDVRYAVAAIPEKSVVPTFTHICRNGLDNRDSYVAISSYTTDFKPHISIANVNKIDSSFIEEFKKAADSRGASAISFLNLWSDSEMKDRFYGNISHIYISYGGVNTYVAI
jgi:hypothetical protein